MKEVVLAFIECINAHDVAGLSALMSDDHTFTDAHGNQVSGREKMIAGWRGYFEWFPDYYIEVTDVFEDGDNLALFGFAGGSFKHKETESLASARGLESYRERQLRNRVASLCRHENSV